MTSCGLTTMFMGAWLLTGGAANAIAQEGHVLVGGGAGVVNPLHGDLQFTAPAWHLSLRGHAGRFVAFEVAYDQWQHTERQVYRNVTFAGGSGTFGRIEVKTERVTRTGAIDVLLRAASGRVAVWGGGGPAYMDFTRRYREQFSDCRGTAPCKDTESVYSSGAFAAHASGGLDVRLVARLALFGRFSAAVPVDDPGSGELALTGGIRLKVW